MSNRSPMCLSPEVLEQIGRNQVSSDQLIAAEEHISVCLHCRQTLDGYYTSNQWSNHIRPALAEPSMSDAFLEDGATEHSSSILRHLGPTDDPSMLGRVGNYEIVGLIGQGGMGAVFKGYDRSLNRFVAIKMLLPHLAASGAARKRFAREGQAVAAVIDDHVMAIHCVDTWRGIPYLVMTYSRGVSLQKRLNDHGPLEVCEILRIGMQAAKGLAAAHAQGIVHRDIKPSNILLDQSVERVQLVDFGLARAVDDASLTCAGTLAGTPQYMSPEQARAETIDHRSDLFSLGSVLYAMCVGHAPFRADSSYSVLRLISDTEPRPIREVNSNIPEWLCAIIERLMSKSTEDRYGSAKEVAVIFEKCLAHVQDPVQHSLPPSTHKLDGGQKLQHMFISPIQKWLQIMNDKKIASLIALILVLVAFLGPWPIATAGNHEFAIAFAVTGLLLAFGLALLSRSEYFSRIVLWGFSLTLGLCALGMVLSLPIWMYRMSNLRVMQAESEAAARVKAAIEAKQAELNRDQRSEVIESLSGKSSSRKHEATVSDDERDFGSTGFVGQLFAFQEVVDDLSLTEDQLSAIDLIRDEGTQRYVEELQKLQIPLSADTRRMLQPKKKVIFEKCDTGIQDLLSPAQQMRLRGLMIQKDYCRSLSFPPIATHIRLTDDQKAKVAELDHQQREATRKKVSEKGTHREIRTIEELRIAIQRISADTAEKAREILTDEQREMVDSMKGELIEFKVGRRKTLQELTPKELNEVSPPDESIQ